MESRCRYNFLDDAAVVICSSSVSLESNSQHQPAIHVYCPLNWNLTPRYSPRTYLSSSSISYWMRLHCLHRPACSDVGACFHVGSQSISGSSVPSRSSSAYYLRVRRCCFVLSGFEIGESYNSAQMMHNICAQKPEVVLGERNAAFGSLSGSAACSSCRTSVVGELHSAGAAMAEVGSIQALQLHFWLMRSTF